MRSKKFLLSILNGWKMKKIKNIDQKQTRKDFRILLVSLILTYSFVFQSVAVVPVVSAESIDAADSENKNQEQSVQLREDALYETERQDEFTNPTIIILDKKYQRKGNRTRVFETFTLPENVIAPFIFQITNGDAFGANKFLDATVKINGVQVFGSGELNLFAPNASPFVI